MTGTSFPAALSLRQTSKPSMSGSMTSRTIRSGVVASACRMASEPFAAVLTAQPWNFSATWTSSRMSSSSSTTRTRGIRSASAMTDAGSQLGSSTGAVLPSAGAYGMTVMACLERQFALAAELSGALCVIPRKATIRLAADHDPAGIVGAASDLADDEDPLSCRQGLRSNAPSRLDDPCGPADLPGPGGPVGRLDDDRAAGERLHRSAFER